MRRHTFQDRLHTRRRITAGVFTGLQVVSLWAAGRRRWWAWLLGGSVQLPWIANAVMTDQVGFIPGCAISASVQTYSFLHNSTRTNRSEAMA